LIAALLASAAALVSHGQAPAGPSATLPAQSGPGNSVSIHGHITDQTGALIPGATVTITDATGNVVRTLKADASGAYEARGNS